MTPYYTDRRKPVTPYDFPMSFYDDPNNLDGPPPDMGADGGMGPGMQSAPMQMAPAGPPPMDPESPGLHDALHWLQQAISVLSDQIGQGAPTMNNCGVGMYSAYEDFGENAGPMEHGDQWVHHNSYEGDEYGYFPNEHEWAAERQMNDTYDQSGLQEAWDGRFTHQYDGPKIPANTYPKRGLRVGDAQVRSFGVPIFRDPHVRPGPFLGKPAVTPSDPRFQTQQEQADIRRARGYSQYDDDERPAYIPDPGYPDPKLERQRQWESHQWTPEGRRQVAEIEAAERALHKQRHGGYSAYEAGGDDPLAYVMKCLNDLKPMIYGTGYAMYADAPFGLNQSTPRSLEQQKAWFDSLQDEPDDQGGSSVSSGVTGGPSVQAMKEGNMGRLRSIWGDQQAKHPDNQDFIYRVMETMTPEELDDLGESHQIPRLSVRGRNKHWHGLAGSVADRMNEFDKITNKNYASDGLPTDDSRQSHGNGPGGFGGAYRPDYYGQPSDHADLSPHKAREILHDGTVHGHPITDKQRRFFGAVSDQGNYALYNDNQELGLWRHNSTTGYWDRVRGVTPETADQWTQVWQKDEPEKKFQVSKRRPRPQANDPRPG